MKAISIVVPTLNEADNIPVLAQRIKDSFLDTGIRYEIVFVDDHSKDGTRQAIEKLTRKHSISFATKDGPRGKAYSLLQGFEMAKYEVICMIDADLQYPPEAIVPMYRLMVDHNIDMVLTEREDHETSKLRQLSSKVFNFAFTRMLFGFNYDSQSGLKLFKKTVIKQATLTPTPWSFDLEFIVRALENNFRILSFKIPFSDRYSGEAKVRVLKVTYELAKASIRLRFNSSPRKVKHAYRMNLQLAASLGCFLIVPLLAVITSLIITPAPKAQALSLPNPLQAIRSLITPVQPATSQPVQPDSYTISPASTSVSNPAQTQQLALSPTETASKNSGINQSTNASQPIKNTLASAQFGDASVAKSSLPTYPPSRSKTGFAYSSARKPKYGNVLSYLTYILISSLAVILAVLIFSKIYLIPSLLKVNKRA